MSGAVAALIPAAGAGERLGRGPKAFVPLAGRTLLERSVAALAPHVDHVVVAVPAELVAYAAELLPAVSVIGGGASRQETVLRLLEETVAPWVLVHDAARPFLPASVVVAAIDAARRYRAVTVALPVADTLYDQRNQRTVDRTHLHAIQTPQAFARALLLEAHHRAPSSPPATDDAGLVRNLGHTVGLVAGSAWLRKITTADDLELAEALAAVWRDR